MNQPKTIREQIEFLKELQVVDSEIYALNRDKEKAPLEIKALGESLETKKIEIKEAEGKLKNSQVKLKEKEMTLQEKEEQVKKLQTQLYQLKTNKEYSAMLSEIEGIKADSSLIEEEIIKLMEEIDLSKKKMVEEKQLFKNEEVDAQKKKGVINAKLKEIDTRLLQLSAKRKEIVPNIEANILARYDRVLKNRDGLAMVPVEDGACGGCHMNFPPQVINDVKLREQVIVCNSCSRILYIDDNVEID